MAKELVWNKQGRYLDKENLHGWFEFMEEVEEMVVESPRVERWATQYANKYNAMILFFNDREPHLLAEFIEIRDVIIKEYEDWKIAKGEEE